MLHRIGAVPFKPLHDNGHQPMQVKRHEVCSVLLRHTVSVKDRRDNMAEQLGIALLQPPCRCR